MKTSVYTFYEQTIIDNIDFNGYGISAEDCEAMELYDKVQKIYEIFLGEYGHKLKITSRENAFADWLQGLPTTLSVPFYYNEILENAKKAGIDYTNKSEKLQDAFLQRYWINLSNAFFTLKDNL